MINANSIVAMNSSGQQTRVIIALSVSGSYVAGGDTFDPTPLIGDGYLNEVFAQNNPPKWGDVQTSSGFIGAFIPGSTIQNGKIKWVVSSTGSEVAAGTYASGAANLAADPNLTIELVFDKLL